MTNTQMLHHWQALTDLLRAARQGHHIDHQQTAAIASALLPHAPGFRYTLNRIVTKSLHKL